MISRVHSGSFLGIAPFLITVETDIQRGLPKFDVVGLAQGAVQEGRNRILSALRSLGVTLSAKRVTVNLAPAAVPKEGASLDLPIALGLLKALGALPSDVLGRWLSLGELSLDGTLHPVRGGVVLADFAREGGWQGLILPRNSAAEAVAEGLQVLAPASLGDLVAHLRGERELAPPPDPEGSNSVLQAGDWSEVRGQALAKRALEIGAAGQHNILLMGSPGIGKTLLARRMATILPTLGKEASREVRRIRSLAGLSAGSLDTPPFRSPHQNASYAGMVGGGKPFRPGELTLAHRGVLFLDELPEFRRDVLEALREPLESGTLTLARGYGTFSLPANFLFLGAMNLCPCGKLGDPRLNCLCPPPVVDRYRSKVSSPVRDRIDLTVELSCPSWDEIWKGEEGETSQVVGERVLRARKVQRERQGGTFNGNLDPKRLREVVQLDTEGVRLLAAAMDKFALSARGVDRVLRVARTIADMEECPVVRKGHLAEAVQFRSSSL